jgi:hypothetical protein
MGDESGERSSSFVFRDRRRFDAEGNTKPEEQVEPVPQTTATQAAKPEPAQVPKQEDPEVEEPGAVSFAGFVMSLATQAMVQLGEMDPPPGMEIPKDPDGAMQTIELLAMLQRKTRGNLSEPEVKMLEDILHNLRIGYVRSVRR